MKIRGTVGRINDSAIMAVVIIDDPEDFMPARRARAFAMRLIKAADQAEAEMQKRREPKP